MRCIEILTFYQFVLYSNLININMRCIEIYYPSSEQELLQGLTLTWDVLKLIYPLTNLTIAMRLTLTWDVLK